MDELNKFLSTLIEGESISLQMKNNQLCYISSYYEGKPYRSLVIKY